MNLPSVPFPIQRVSLRYVATHDRLRLDAVDASGATCALWLTRRLAAAWITSLAQWLEKTSPVASAAPAAVRQEAVAMESAAITARRQQEPTRPVAASMPPRLLEAIDLARQNRRWSMTFRCVAEPGEETPFAARLVSDPETVHHLAQVLAQQIQVAGWLQGLALGWLAEATRTPPAAPGTLLN